MRKIKEQTKKNITRVIMIVLAVIMIISFVMLPAAQSVSAEGVGVVVDSFDTGKLSEAIDKAKDGADLNNITSLAVSGGTMNSADYSAVCGYPNIEFLELAGCDTEDGVIPDNALSSRNHLTYISLPANTESIGSRAFSGNRSLLKISIPSTLRKIGDYAFEGCEKVEEFSIPAEVTSIGTGAFSDCKALKSFALPEAITVVPEYCFAKCNLTEMHFGPQITEIGNGAFSDCHTLTDIYFYGTEAPAAAEGSFQNLKVTIHTYEDSESFDDLESNFVSVAYDLSEDSKYIPPQPSENPNVTEKTVEEENEDDNEEAAETEAEKSQESVSETEESAENAEKVQESEQTNANAGGISGVYVIVIAVLCAALGVTVTLLIVKKK